MDRLSRLREILSRAHDLSNAANILEWDQETYMPTGGSESRASQIATLRGIEHTTRTSTEVRDLIADLESAPPDGDKYDQALVRVARRDFDRMSRIPSDLVAATAHAVSRAMQAWRPAKQEDDYGLFRPHLEALIGLNLEKADAIGFEETAYDALLDEYEPGMTTSRLDRIFGEVRRGLVPMADAIFDKAVAESDVLYRAYPHDVQWNFGHEVATDIGYDFDRGRQDISAHPFSTAFSINDVRITTRIYENYFAPGFFGTLHEVGHALYEQNIDQSLEGTPLADGTSLGMHESQSRLWENLIGRSRPFWRHYLPRLNHHSGGLVSDVDAEDFYRACSFVKPSLIRVEADEVTYNLHIMLRYDLERLMLSGQLPLDDLPDVWSSRMEEYIGVRPTSDSDGVLQDIHWALGTFGYFPTYTLGNLMSVQLIERARIDLPELDQLIERGDFAPLREWLRVHVHRHGRMLTADEIMTAATGSSLSPAPWLKYIREKYTDIYGRL